VTDEKSGDVPSVLVVENETQLADLYTQYLDDRYEVDVAYSGEEAIEMVDVGYDVVLLDRRMPDVSGNEILASIEENGIDCRIALVTAVNPDFEIIDLRADDYLVKPVTRPEVLDTVDRLLRLEVYSERMQELTTKRIKHNVLSIEKPRSVLEESEAFQQLKDEIAELEAEVEAIADELDVGDLERRI